MTHRHGTCSRLTNGKAASPDHAEILRLDQSRVNSIHSKLSKKLTDRVRQSQSTNLPAKDGSTLGSGNYVVTVGIGTPKHDLSLIFDTGSDLTWTQCEPCVQTCYSQKEPILNPSSSSSYHNVSCSSAACASLSSATGSILDFVNFGNLRFSDLDSVMLTGVFLFSPRIRKRWTLFGFELRLRYSIRRPIVLCWISR